MFIYLIPTFFYIKRVKIIGVSKIQPFFMFYFRRQMNLVIVLVKMWGFWKLNLINFDIL